jgi:uncharacterized protein YkwD
VRRLQRTPPALAVALLLAASLVPLVLHPSSAVAAPRVTRLEGGIISAVNAARDRAGLHGVRAQSDLLRAARAHSRSMAHDRYFSHLSVGGGSFAQRLVRLGYERSGRTGWSAGEAIASGTSGPGMWSAAGVVSAWLHSAPHRAVLLGAKFRDIGVGVHRAGDTRYFTLDMGRRSP